MVHRLDCAGRGGGERHCRGCLGFPVDRRLGQDGGPVDSKSSDDSKDPSPRIRTSPTPRTIPNLRTRTQRRSRKGRSPKAGVARSPATHLMVRAPNPPVDRALLTALLRMRWLGNRRWLCVQRRQHLYGQPERLAAAWLRYGDGVGHIERRGQSRVFWRHLYL